MPLSLSIQSRLQHQHTTIMELIKDYPEEKVKVRSIPGKWSAFENIAHVVRYQVIFQERMNTILNTPNPSFDRYVAENDPGFDIIIQSSLAQLLESLQVMRHEIHKTLTSLPDKQLAKTGTHPKFGTLSLVQWSEFFLLHEAHHLFTLFKLLNDTETGDSR